MWTTTCFAIGIGFGLLGLFTGGLTFTMCGLTWTTLGVMNSSMNDEEDD